MTRRECDEERYPGTSQRCPKCRRSFRVLADEAGEHECPHCGYYPDDNDEREDEDNDE